jgi:hypothetical protein
MSEVRFASTLKSVTLPFTYEADILPSQYDPQKYTVDFTVHTKHNGPIFFEFKGKFDAAARKKMRAVKKSNPKADIRIVFERPQNKLYKGAKMRYWEWCERHGFKWYAASDVKKIKSDVSGGGRCRRRKL